MSTSAREAILAKIAQLVSTATGFTSSRSRQAPVAREEGIVAIIEPDEESVEKVGVEVVVRKLTVSVIFIGRAAIPDQDLDTALQSMHAALMADLTLGGIAAKIVEESTRWNFELADLTAAATQVRYVVHYLTPAATFAVLA